MECEWNANGMPMECEWMRQSLTEKANGPADGVAREEGFVPFHDFNNSFNHTFNNNGADEKE